MVAVPVKYNPGILGDDDLVRAFVVRHKCLELILETLKENAGAASSNRHLLVVGPRGIGKTMLVRRVAAEVRSNPEYGSFWFPIVYGEESYQVSSAGEFWLEALVHLSEQSGGPNLDRTLDELRQERNDGRLRERALAQLLDFADHQGKRLLLVVENLNMLCDQISPEAAWELRHTLSGERRIMLLATATSRFDSITNAGEAWFELFAVHELKPLDCTESDILWRSVADQDLKPGQVRAMRILTGGNPRLLTVLACFAANRSFRELMEQLVHLIDDHTEYFKGHLDVLPPKERKVFVALLEQWNPVAAAQLARTTRFNVNEVSALLNRLVSRGAVELFEQRPRRKLYQAAERLYNIYYLLRRRGQPADRVRAAVSFMVMFYGGRQLATSIADLAREACGLPVGEIGEHFVAYAEFFGQVPMVVGVSALDQTPTGFFHREDIPEFGRPFAKAAEALQCLRKAESFSKAKVWLEAEEALRRAVQLHPTELQYWVSLLHLLWKTGQLQEAGRILEEGQQFHPGLYLFPVSLLAARLRDGEVPDAILREAEKMDPRGRVTKALVQVLGAQGRWASAWELIRPVLDAAATTEAAQETATDLLIQAAAAGHAREAINLLQTSKAAAALEPLLVGLRIYLGETPQIAKEISEIGQDVAARIREIARLPQ